MTHYDYSLTEPIGHRFTKIRNDVIRMNTNTNIKNKTNYKETNKMIPRYQDLLIRLLKCFLEVILCSWSLLLGIVDEKCTFNNEDSY